MTVTTSFLKLLPGIDMPQSVTEALYDLRIGPLVGVFLLISALAHFIMASPVGFPWYVRNLRKKINYLRWYEYALSASLMVVIIALLSGVVIYVFHSSFFRVLVKMLLGQVVVLNSLFP